MKYRAIFFSPPVPAAECAAFIADPARISAVIDSVSEASSMKSPPQPPVPHLRLRLCVTRV